MRVALILALLMPALLPAQGRSDKSSMPVKKVEKFTRTSTDTFKDSDGDGINDYRSTGKGTSFSLKGILDAIINRASGEKKVDEGGKKAPEDSSHGKLPGSTR